MKRIKFFVMALYGVLLPLLTVGQDAEPISLFDQFCQQTDSLPQLKLDTNWGRLLRTKMNEQYQEGQFSFHNSEGEWVSIEVKLKTRGNVRKQICNYPPVKVKIPKRELKRMGYNAMNELKFVFPCGNSKKDLDYLYREALVYQLYEYIHPLHLRSSLAKVEAVRGEKLKFDSYCLLVEHGEQIEERLEAKVLKKGIITAGALERDSYLKMVFFQYMIYNTDWSVPNRHNLMLVYVPDFAKQVVPIPYDFDYCGFVDAHYAVPAEEFPIKSVRERYFRGRDVTEEEARATAQFFLEKKEALLQHAESYAFLDTRSHKDVMDSLTSFFEILEKEKKMLKTFVTLKEK